MNDDILNQPGRHRLGDNLYLWVRSPTNRQFIAIALMANAATSHWAALDG